MKFDEGMWLNGKPNQNPLNTTRIVKNLIYNLHKARFENENGNVYIDSFGSNKTPIGFITLDHNDFVVFSKINNTDSRIGYVDENLVYKDLKVDASLGFRYDRPIHGEFQRTPNGERIIAFTDGYGTFKYYNLDRNTETSNMEVFAHTTRPSIQTDIINGGNLKSGAWYIVARYEKDDRAVSSWWKDYNPIYLGTAEQRPDTGSGLDKRAGIQPNLNTGKSIRLQISNLDQKYKKLQIGVVTQINNVRTAFYVKTINVQTGTQFVTIANMQELQPITLDEVLIDRANYKSVELITQFENTLYAVGLTTYDEPVQQSKINEIKFKWKSTLIDFGSNRSFKEHELNNKTGHFQHFEVYALYVRLRYYWGVGQWWHVPGRQAEGYEINYQDQFRVFQLDDTCKTDGTLGYWENIDERYPNTGYYPTGNVRHVRMPSIRWMKENVYQNEPMYGSSKLDVLNLEMDLTTFNLNDFKDCEGNPAIGYQIGYAKRVDGNSIVSGQSIFIGSADFVTGEEELYTSLGFNATHNDPNSNGNSTTLNLSKIRTWDYRMLFNKATDNINYVRSEVALSDLFDIVDTKNPAYDFNNVRRGIVEYYKNPATIPVNKITRVLNNRFVINNTLLSNIDNTFLEDTVLLDLQSPLTIPITPVVQSPTWGQKTSYTQLLTLLSVQNNAYISFTDQEVVVCDSVPGTNIYGGDAYIYINSIVAFGTTTQRSYSTDPAQHADNNIPQNGTRIAHVFLSEGKFNMAFRYVNPATIGGSTKYFPPNDPTDYLPRLRRDQEPNLITQGYSTDYNARNDLQYSDVFNSVNDEARTNILPFVGIRGQQVSNTVDFTPWIDFKINDTYQLDRTRGRIVNLVAGKEFLIFHHEKALFVTRTRQYLDVQGEAAFVGTGDVFEGRPIEVVHSELGSLGTQHKWSCQLTPYGYFFIDAESGQYINYNGQADIVSDKGLRDFFRQYSFNPGDNPYTSDGWFSVFDSENKRLLVTRKIKKLPSELEKSYKGVWRNDKIFLSSLKAGDIVYKDGKYQFVK
jgi:hypothetical protein